jgi:FlaA1/EpsC-like NDP-sugar epimerase|tara:strand:+ start:2990 stop:4906 length:1917 start_codon:yes stop_codon:yes gene_type:complete
MLQSFKQAILALPRPVKRAIALCGDIAMCAIAVRIAFYLRLEIWSALDREQLFALIGSAVLAAPIFITVGLYRAIFRYGGSMLLKRIFHACLIYGLLYAFIFTFWRVEGVPRSVGLMQPVILFLLVASSRIAVSWFLGDAYAQARSEHRRRKVAIYGGGVAGRSLCQALDQSELKVVAFIDDDTALHGQLLLGRPIIGIDAVKRFAERRSVSDVLLAIPSATRGRRNEIIEEMRPLPVAVRQMPGMSELATGKIKTQEFRDLDVDDLLGRNLVMPDEDLLARNIAGKSILVTGAGGSIGSEICRQIVARAPSDLLLVETSELALYVIHRELEQHIQRDGLATRLVPLLGSVCDAARMSAILTAWEPSTVYHAAAYKHVPLVEYNPSEGVWNNTFGTLTVAKAALEAGVANFVFVSTDKAVRPTNIMGTSKRLAELVLQALAATSANTCFSMVRFGNVLGSSGSVVPLFREQIRNGGPITLTHGDVTRYFMTIPEASQLVIQAGAMAKGGEVFVLDMGSPIRIQDLARRMIELSGLTVRDEANPEGDIPLEIVGLRPGEKLHEELLIGNAPVQTSHPQIMMAREHFIEWSLLEGRLEELREKIALRDITGLLMLLEELVTEYRPETQVHDLVHMQQAAE